MKIYVASSWRNQFQQEVVALLRAEGHEVYDLLGVWPGEEEDEQYRVVFWFDN